MERIRLSALVKDVEMGGDIDVVIAADAQRALDAERERTRVAAQLIIETIGSSGGPEDLEEALGRLVAKWTRQIDNIKHYQDQLATLQAQLAAMTESRDAWRLAQECSEKAYMSLATQIPSERYDYDPVNLALLDGAKEQERIGRKQIADLQAQLRQVEGQSKTQAEEAVIVFAKYTTLRQLVAALPVVDVQEVSVWLSPDESGWLVSKRPAFPAGLYWAKFRTQAEADSFRALLAYRATLDATTPATTKT